MAAAGATFLARLKNAPFPYDGVVPETGRPFFDATDPSTGERMHTTGNGDRYGEAAHYRDDRVLVHIPGGADPRTQPAIVVFFHGHLSSLEREVAGRLAIPAQIDASGRNVLLVAPQLAVEAMDSSPGKLWQPGSLKRLLDEAARVLTERMGGDGAGAGAGGLDRAPLVLIAFSGGYKALAAGLAWGGAADRVVGVVLLDAVFGEEERLASWLATSDRAFLVGLFTPASAAGTGTLLHALERQGMPCDDAYPRSLRAGSRHVVAVPTGHLDVPVKGPPAWPVADLLRRAGSLQPRADAALQHNHRLFAAVHKND